MKNLGAVVAVFGTLASGAPVKVAAQTTSGVQSCQPGDKLETEDGSPAECLITGKRWVGRVDGSQVYIFRGNEGETIRFTSKSIRSFDQMKTSVKAFCKPIVSTVVAAGWTAGPLEQGTDSSDGGATGKLSWVEYTFPSTGDYEVALTCRVIGMSADVSLLAEKR